MRSCISFEAGQVPITPWPPREPSTPHVKEVLSIPKTRSASSQRPAGMDDERDQAACLPVTVTADGARAIPRPDGRWGRTPAGGREQSVRSGEDYAART